jgi:hypothetical protein
MFVLGVMNSDLQSMAMLISFDCILTTFTIIGGAWFSHQSKGNHFRNVLLRRESAFSNDCIGYLSGIE